MKQYLIGFILGIALIGGIWWGKSCNNKKPPSPLTKIEKTTSDTLLKDKYTQPIIDSKGTIEKKPEIVIKYIEKPILVPDLRYEVINDTIKFKSKDSFFLRIPIKPLSLFPKSPQLVYGKFTHDSIRMDIMKLSGDLLTYTYTPDFINNRYEFIEGEMRISKNLNPQIITIPKARKFYTESNLWVSTNPLNKNWRFSLDYSAMFKRVGLFGLIEFNTVSTPQHQLHGGIRIKIK